MKLVFIPEAFDRQLTAGRVKAILSEAARTALGDVEPHTLTPAIGGEALFESFRAALGGQFIVMPVTGPCGVAVRARYLSAGDTAVIAASEVAGAHLQQPGFSPMTMTSYGVGELIAHALTAGHKHVVVGLGGVITMDAGVGLAAALGVRFEDKAGRPFLPVGQTLEKIHRIAPNHFFLQSKVQWITALCDTEASAMGANGVADWTQANVGLSCEDARQLEAGVRHLADTIKRQGGDKLLGRAGGAMAGGMALGMAGLLRAKLSTRDEDRLAALGLEKTLEGADCVVLAGDVQTMLDRGWVKLAAQTGGRVVLFSPALYRTQDEWEALEKTLSEAGVTAHFEIYPIAETAEGTPRYDIALKRGALQVFGLLAKA